MTESKESHARDYSGGEGEEEGTLYDIDYKYDKEKNGVKLILSYDKDKSKFTGSVENITNKTIRFEKWNTHAEVGSGESEHELESGEEHNNNVSCVKDVS